MKQRMYELDHLRTALTVLVIVFHTSIAYGGAGDWILEDVDKSELNLTMILLTIFTAVCQAFFMGLFFFLSAYFIPSSYDRKGAAKFLKDRMIRLGLPLAAYYFLIGPLTHWYAHLRDDMPVGTYYSRYVWSFDQTFFGPAWFLEASIYFAFLYAFLRLTPLPGKLRYPLPIPSAWGLAGIAAALGLVSFLVRLVYPTGEGPLELQLGYFPSYILCFAAGIWAYRGNWLEQLPDPLVRTWSRIAIVAIPVLPVAFIATGALEGNLNFAGGWELQALLYALWEPFVGFGLILMLLRWFRIRWSQTNALLRFGADHAYAVYVIHPPVIVGWTIAFQGIVLPAALKWVIVSSLSVFVCFVLAALIRRLPGAKRML
ncbi:acyltransferase family protein [Paenibacillus xanthanilyticus]|uniref:Acyltransferase n=1 Tax=Paenibacillus xanthanilyticus TaxID=1783531 RepID=A0ABV8JWR8_9BACL